MNSNLEGDEETFRLISTEGLSEQVTNVDVPIGLIPRLYNEHDAQSRVLDKLMIKFAKANFSRSKDGLVTVGSKVMNIKFDDFVLDCCNGKFSQCYEELYCLLRKNGITF